MLGVFSPPMVFVIGMAAVVLILTMVIPPYVNDKSRRRLIKPMWFVALMLCWVGLALVVLFMAWAWQKRPNVLGLVVCAVGVIVMGTFAAMIDDIDDMATAVTLGTIILGLAYFVILINAVGGEIGLGWLVKRGRRLYGRVERKAGSVGRRVGSRVRRLR